MKGLGVQRVRGPAREKRAESRENKCTARQGQDLDELIRIPSDRAIGDAKEHRRHQSHGSRHAGQGRRRADGDHDGDADEQAGEVVRVRHEVGEIEHYR